MTMVDNQIQQGLSVAEKYNFFSIVSSFWETVFPPQKKPTNT